MNQVTKVFENLDSQLNEVFKSLLKEVDRLQTRINEFALDNHAKNERITEMKADSELHIDFLNSITPVKVYHHKKRGNTTVIFLDKSSVTVRKMKGDKDCLETAIAYALCKKIYPKQVIENLVKNCEETGENE